jgi:hypothetical protein
VRLAVRVACAGVRFPVDRPEIGRSIARFAQTQAADARWHARCTSAFRDERAPSRASEENAVNIETIDRAQYELRFQSLSDTGRALAFPCDATGRVDMDALGSLALNDYLYARTVVGREFRRPCVRIRLDD